MRGGPASFGNTEQSQEFTEKCGQVEPIEAQEAFSALPAPSAKKSRYDELPPDKILSLAKAHFKYDAVREGLFHRIGKKHGHAVRTFKLGNGHVGISWLGTSWVIHRIIWMIVNDEPLGPKDEIDHKDRNRKHNVPSNFRKVTHQQNQWNAGLRSDNTSGFRGVSRTRTGVYSANITIDGKPLYLGVFKTALEASEAYQAKAREIRGEYVPGAAA